MYVVIFEGHKILSKLACQLQILFTPSQNYIITLWKSFLIYLLWNITLTKIQQLFLWCFHTCICSWLDPLIWTGYKRELKQEDLYATPDTCRSQNLLSSFRRYTPCECTICNLHILLIHLTLKNIQNYVLFIKV